MSDRIKPKLTVRMFGGFSVSYAGEPITLGRQTSSKFCQLFQLLLTRPGRQFSKREIMRCLYGQESVEDANATLNNTVFRLRRCLDASPLPAGEYLTVGDGMIRFEELVPVDCDVWRFERLSRSFDKETGREKRIQIAEEACGLYIGELLPRLAAEQWVIERDKVCREAYFRMLRYLLEHRQKERNYREIQRLSAAAASIQLFGEWRMWQVDALVSLGKPEEAMAAYRELLDHLWESGEPPAEPWMKRLRELDSRIQLPREGDDTLRGFLREEKPSAGAYPCPQQSFLDYCHILERQKERLHTEYCVLVCTIEGIGKNAQTAWQRCAAQGPKLEKAFHACLRSGDLYTKYSAGQYLLLCTGCRARDAREIGNRVDARFQKLCGGRYRAQLRVLDLETGKI